ncbi:MAG TPA: hypothetical protein VLI39_14190 [Sedimentisphaerales bacterium]|nr:hypothetical protein [Sedimentisphaerales bacterium]
MGGAGPEQTALSLSKTPISEKRGTESGTVDARNAAQTDPDLAQIVKTWPDLAASVRAEILRLAGLTKEQR